MSSCALLGVQDLAGAYRNGSVTPTDAVTACLDMIAKIDGHIFAWQEVYADEAKVAALKATEEMTRMMEADKAMKVAENGEPVVSELSTLSPMFGVPFALKDIIDVEGKITTAGSATRREAIATTTATIAKRLMDAGAICIGKVKTVEFGRWTINLS